MRDRKTRRGGTQRVAERHDQVVCSAAVDAMDGQAIFHPRRPSKPRIITCTHILLQETSFSITGSMHGSRDRLTHKDKAAAMITKAWHRRECKERNENPPDNQSTVAAFASQVPGSTHSVQPNAQTAAKTIPRNQLSAHIFFCWPSSADTQLTCVSHTSRQSMDRTVSDVVSLDDDRLTDSPTKGWPCK